MYPGVFGLVRIRSPKTARTLVHGKQQYVAIEDEGLAQHLAAALASDPNHFAPLAAWNTVTFLAAWKRGLLALGLPEDAFVPSGLREEVPPIFSSAGSPFRSCAGGAGGPPNAL